MVDLLLHGGWRSHDEDLAFGSDPPSHRLGGRSISVKLLGAFHSEVSFDSHLLLDELGYDRHWSTDLICHLTLHVPGAKVDAMALRQDSLNHSSTVLKGSIMQS